MHKKWASEEEYLVPPGLYKVECFISPYPYLCFLPGDDVCIIDNLSRLQTFSSNEFHIATTNEEEKKLEECINISEIKERENCIKTLALEQKNKDLCQYLQPNERKEIECRIVIEVVNNEKLATCRTVSPLEPETYSEECIKKIAIEINEIKLCDFTKNEETRKACYITVSMKRDDLESCKLGSYEGTVWCYTGIAIKRNDPEICYELIKDYQYVPEDDCFMDLAIYTNDPNHCSHLGYRYMKDDCFYRIAVNKTDSTICQLIEDFNQKENCRVEILTKKYPKINK